MSKPTWPTWFMQWATLKKTEKMKHNVKQSEFIRRTGYGSIWHYFKFYSYYLCTYINSFVSCRFFSELDTVLQDECGNTELEEWERIYTRTHYDLYYGGPFNFLNGNAIYGKLIPQYMVLEVVRLGKFMDGLWKSRDTLEWMSFWKPGLFSIRLHNFDDYGTALNTR